MDISSPQYYVRMFLTNICPAAEWVFDIFFGGGLNVTILSILAKAGVDIVNVHQYVHLKISGVTVTETPQMEYAPLL